MNKPFPSSMPNALQRILRFAASLALALACLIPSVSLAQSACTAMWATLNGTQAITYYNGSAGTAAKWTTIANMPGTVGNANALAVDSTTGLLWFYDRVGFLLYSFNPNTNAFSAGVALSTATPAAAGNGNIIGATFDASGNLYLFATAPSTGQAFISQVTNKATGTNGAWTQITTASGGTPLSGGSGDIAFDPSGQAWWATNTNPVGLYPLTLTTAKVGASITYSLGSLNVAGLAVNPATGLMHLGTTSNGSVTYQINSSIPNAATLTDATTDLVSDMGSCAVAPAKPTVSKAFSPSFSALSGATTTLTIVLGNSNSMPIWLNSTFTDTFPTGMTVAATPNLTAGACAASATVTNVITATAGASTLTFANGGRIPAGGCTITLSVTAPASASGYTNTVAAGALSTTSGSNASTATAVYTVGTDFSAAKVQGVGTSGPYTSGAQTTPGGRTMQYVLTITNSSSGGTGSATFTDTMPSLVTPVLTITAGMSGGGSCTTASAVINGATVITGTVTNAPAGAICTVTVTTNVSATQTVATTVINTLTLAPTASTSDTNSTNNSATVSTTISASALLTIAKTNGVSTLVAGSTTSYTVTVANLGPAAAGGSVVSDPVATGLNCTAVTCAVSAGTATCPASPTISAFQSPGLTLSTFNANSTVSFVVTCTVTATGQ